MGYDAEVVHFMGPTMVHFGLALGEVSDSLTYGGLPAGAVFYQGADCKVQICWSARDGGLDFMLAPLDAPNELGLINSSKKWQFMLMLDDSEDGLTTPPVGSDADTWWTWRKALFAEHFEAVGTAVRHA